VTDDGWTLQDLVCVPGVRHAIVCTSDGLVHTRSASLSLDEADVLAATCAGLYSLGAGIAEQYGDADKSVRQQMVEYTGGLLFIRATGTGRLAVLTGPQVDPGVVAQQMARLIRQLGAQTLSSPARGGAPA